MSATEPFAVKWGILATGGIATTFVKDILTNPATRNVHDIKHIVYAAASSSSAERAQDFLKKVGAPESAKAYGSYFELVNDPEIDIIYVATPHSHHFQNTMLALNAGKNVLCEKAFTVNAKQAKLLIDTARAKGLFLMEAVWTRYFPLSVKIRELVKDGVIGKVHRVTADLSFANDAGDGDRLNFDDSHRMVNLDLAGGALLDLGIYSLTWVFQILYHCQDGEKEPPKIFSAINKYACTGADEQTSVILQFPKNNSQGIATTCLRTPTTPDGEGSSAAGPAARIQGSKGEIQVIGPLYRPLEYRIFKVGGERGKYEVVHCPIPTDPERDNWGHGMFWEADEAARCLKDGKKESVGMPWEESLVIMETMDEIRRQGDLVYPELIDSAVYDEKSELNGKV